MPLCLTEVQQRPPIGCLSPLKSELECLPFYISSAGNWWWSTWVTPAMDERECVANVRGRRGCQLPTEELHMYWYNDTDCECMNGEMMNVWEWTKGQWVGGQVRSMQWIQANMTSQYVWNTSSISFSKMTSWVENSIEDLFLFPIKSESLCSSNIISSALDTLVCDCLAIDSPRGMKEEE